MKSKCYDDSSKLVVSKMQDETGGVAIEEFVRLKPKMYSFLIDDNIENKKANGVNTNVIKRVNHSEYKDVLLNQRFLRHLMNRIQSKIIK